MSELITNFLVSVTSSGVLVWLTKSWISERLKQSIENEYKIGFEKLRSDLEVSRLRTGFFFDHQRVAFSEILTLADELNKTWLHEGTSEDKTIISAPLVGGYQQLVTLGSRHRLFLDADAHFGFQVLVGWYEGAINSADGVNYHEVDTSEFYDYASFSADRLATVFQQKIGVSDDKSALLDLIVLVSVYKLNRVKLGDMVGDLPSFLKMEPYQPAASIVRQVSMNIKDLRTRLEETRRALAELNILEGYRAEFSACVTILDRFIAGKEAP